MTTQAPPPEDMPKKVSIRPIRRSAPIPRPPSRRLRGYAFDPSLSIQLETMGINEIVFKVPWEESLQKGPVGEYLEVVDYDPASNCFYEPVDLDNPRLMAQDGLAPSQGNPQFHQQMVYAVAMTTIKNFEQALGRKALWRAHKPEQGSERANCDDGQQGEEAQQGDGKQTEFVKRLRIYPHAMREANAYYSPDKEALLFGYFPATTNRPDSHMAGGTVFTCLSHDVIAHETTHALLDGMHRRFIEPTHPDALAFHEAFADIIALFQHFSFPEVLRHQIGKTRGDLASQNLLGQLAQEFGVAIGNYGALRDALGQVNSQTGQWEQAMPNPQDYLTIMEPHARGSILVGAVFDAFASIYKRRVEDLMRIASNGTGIMPSGALHPDLVNRLSDEAAKTAKQVLLMCIRALDYCPPVDLTFGDYLRAVITADTDIVPDDDRGYRVAFIEAFRRRGIYPHDVRNLSVESLVWPSYLSDDEDDTFDLLARKMRQVPNRARYFSTRRETYQEIIKLQDSLEKVIKEEICSSDKDLPAFQMLTGLALQKDTHLPGLSKCADGTPIFEVHSLRPAQRVGPDGNLLSQLMISITQMRLVPYYLTVPGSPTLIFRGGCTLILDLDNLHLRYRIVKPINDEDRLQRQLSYVKDSMAGSLRATYFAKTMHSAAQEPFAMLHRSF